VKRATAQSGQSAGRYFFRPGVYENPFTGGYVVELEYVDAEFAMQMDLDVGEPVPSTGRVFIERGSPPWVVDLPAWWERALLGRTLQSKLSAALAQARVTCERLNEFHRGRDIDLLSNQYGGFHGPSA